MTYIVNMASGEPYPDDELDHHQKQVAQQPRTASLLDSEYTGLHLQLVSQQLTHTELNAATSLHINAVLQSLED